MQGDQIGKSNQVNKRADDIKRLDDSYDLWRVS